MANGVPLDLMRVAVIQGLRDRNYTPNTEEPGIVRATMRHRRVELSAEVRYGTQEIQVTLVNQGRNRHEQLDRWMRNLLASIERRALEQHQVYLQTGASAQPAAPVVVQSGTATQPANGQLTCTAQVQSMGYDAALSVHCTGAEARCAFSLLSHGFPPNQLSYCQGVDAVCAEALLDGGSPPPSLVTCRQ